MARNISPSHAAVNLPRLVQRLAARTSDLQKENWVEVRKGYQSVKYAKELVAFVREQEALPEERLVKLGAELKTLESVFKQAVETHPIPSSSAPASATARAIFPPTRSLSSIIPSEVPAEIPPEPVLESSPSTSSPPLPKSTPATVPPRSDSESLPTLTKRESYLAEREDELLPLRASRNAVIAARGSGLGARGAAQLHDELSGQLADMSHQLKLNALHFSSTLNEEKKLLETSSTALETNLSKTKTSKTKLSAVTTKTRGTTWLVLGSILIVLIGWIWTYLLIRMT